MRFSLIVVIAVLGILVSQSFLIPVYSDEIITTIVVDSAPQGVAVNESTNRIYTANAGDHSVTVIDGATNGLITTIAVGEAPTPFGIDVNEATNRIYTANPGEDTVSVIDGATNMGITTIDVGGLPAMVAVNEATNRIYVSNFASASISVINGATNGIVTTIALAGGAAPFSIAVNESTNRIYSADSGNDTITVINGATNGIITTIVMGTDIQGVAVNETTNRIYVSTVGTDTITVINGATNGILTTIDVGSGPGEIAVYEATNRIYVTDDTDDTLTVINTANNTVLETLDLSPSDTSTDVAVNETTNRIYVTDLLTDTVFVIQSTSNTVSGTVFADTNDNGIQDGVETGIAGVTVVLVDGSGTQLPNATTDVDGNYTFTGVAPGTILVQIAPVPTLHLPSTGFNSFAFPILAADETLTQDFPLVPVTTPATVSGTVFADTNDNGVQDPGELGLEGVTVFVVDFLTLTQILPNPVTDADGVYIANGVLPDTVLAQAAPIPDGFLPSTGFNTFAFPALVPGVNTVDFALAPVAPEDEGTITIEVFDDANSNGVKDTGEDGVEGAVVFTFELLTQVADVQVTDTTGITVHTGLIPDVVLAQINAVVLPPGFTTITTTNTVPGAEFVTLTPGASVTVQIGLS